MPGPRRRFLRALSGLALAPLVPGRALAGDFEPPDAEARRKALGSLESLSPELQRVFTPGPEDRPTPRPGPSDWLASHDEPGQSFAAFRRGKPNRPGLVRTKIVLLPLGPLAGAGSPALATLIDFAGRYFGLDAVARPTLELHALKARSRDVGGRRQLHTGDLLDALERRLPAEAYCLIGVTQSDLYPGPAWNFVFGYARLYARVGVYSFARYDPAFHGEARDPDTPRLVLRRGLKLMAHEVGHMFGMEHCIHYRCVMNGSNNLDETDRSPLRPCPVCLRKLHEVVGFDPVVRERRLADFYRAQGLVDESAACERQLARVAG